MHYSSLSVNLLINNFEGTKAFSCHFPDFNSLHPAVYTSLPAPADEFETVFLIAINHSLYRAVTQVFHPASQMQKSGLPPCSCSETHPLDPAAYYDLELTFHGLGIAKLLDNQQGEKHLLFKIGADNHEVHLFCSSAWDFQHLVAEDAFGF